MREGETAAAHRSLLAALQLGDSGLPIGRFVHSHGLEQWLRDHPDPSPKTLGELLVVAVRQMAGPLDAAMLAHAHRARTADGLACLDRALTVRKPLPPARAASESCGRQLALLAVKLVDDPLVHDFADLVRMQRSSGNLAVVEGTLARAMGISVEAAVTLALRDTVIALLSAAIRLGAVSPSQAQVLQVELGGVISEAVSTALTLSVDDLWSSAPELEICALRHARNDVRFFAT